MALVQRRPGQATVPMSAAVAAMHAHRADEALLVVLLAALAVATTVPVREAVTLSAAVSNAPAGSPGYVWEMRARSMDKAAEDRGFRTQLLADPKATISAELGVFIPEEFTIQVHEDSGTSAHLVLPPSDQLTEEDLAQVAGGNWGQQSMDQMEEDMNNL